MIDGVQSLMTHYFAFIASGRWIFERENDETIDLRISILPTLYGEDVTLRLLDRTTRLLSLDKLGLNRKDSQLLRGMLQSPSLKARLCNAVPPLSAEQIDAEAARAVRTFLRAFGRGGAGA